MPTILYAEDDAQVAELVRFLFARDVPDASVQIAANGRECLAALEKTRFDLLLLDLVLPGRDGLAILSELARRGDATPVIVLSSHGQYEQTVSALRAGAADCIDKKGPRFMDIARIARGYLDRAGRGRAARDDPTRNVVLLEHQEQTAQELAAIVGQECPQLRLRTIPSRVEWERWVAAGHSCDALVISDQWELADLTDMLRDFRWISHGGPGILLCRLNRLEVVIAAYALGCRDCVVQRPGYQMELARSLNHLLRRRNPTT
ncbi:MAG TPA: response regulator [Opitutaceae bacterium]|jgi:CheY-like chemotaxis protein|nr:response regulator [Opitutaceae bacterium]